MFHTGQYLWEGNQWEGWTIVISSKLDCNANVKQISFANYLTVKAIDKQKKAQGVEEVSRVGLTKRKTNKQRTFLPRRDIGEKDGDRVLIKIPSSQHKGWSS